MTSKNRCCPPVFQPFRCFEKSSNILHAPFKMIRCKKKVHVKCVARESEQ